MHYLPLYNISIIEDSKIYEEISKAIYSLNNKIVNYLPNSFINNLMPTICSKNFSVKDNKESALVIF